MRAGTASIFVRSRMSDPHFGRIRQSAAACKLPSTRSPAALTMRVPWRCSRAEKPHDIFDQDIPDNLEANFCHDEPYDDPLEPGGVPHLKLVLEHLKHAIQHLQALIDNSDAVIDLEVLARVPENGLPKLVVPEKIRYGQHVWQTKGNKAGDATRQAMQGGEEHRSVKNLAATDGDHNLHDKDARTQELQSLLHHLASDLSIF